MLVSIFAAAANAQSQMDNVLSEIKKNNKTILSKAQYWEAQKIQYKTGNSLYNPTAEYDYLKGSPENAGNQTDITITQSFDFPTAYAKRSQLSEQKREQAAHYVSATTQEVMLEAKTVCIELVYRNKMQLPLEKRKQSTEKWLLNFQKRLKLGDGNILDVNKAELQLIDIKKRYLENLSEIERLNDRLTALNGGKAIVFNDTIYFEVPSIPEFETLEKEIEETDPLRQSLEQEKLIAQKQLEVSKAMALPKMEIGYHYQGILGQTYNGIHTGISLPLWESRNTVKLQKAKISYAETELDDHANDHYYEIRQMYERYENLKLLLAEYNGKINANDNIRLLDKAFALGHISTLEYFTETSYYNTVFNDYLETEKEYYEVVAELLKYKL
jgi:cobalt-zinc-cadmium efflux system outer membrane protein